MWIFWGRGDCKFQGLEVGVCLVPFEEHIWLSLVGCKLEVEAKIWEAGSY